MAEKGAGRGVRVEVVGMEVGRGWGEGWAGAVRGAGDWVETGGMEGTRGWEEGWAGAARAEVALVAAGA